MNKELIQKLMKQDGREVINDMKKVVSTERMASGDVLHYFYVVQRRRLFAEAGYSNIYKFSMKVLRYTEAETQMRVSSSKLLGEIPEIEEKLNQGALSMTAVSMALTLFNRESKNQNTFSLEKKAQVLESFQNKSIRECEKEVLKFATVLPPPKEKTKNISENLVQVTLNMPREFLEHIETLKNLMAHSNPKISTSELVARFIKEAAIKKDPTREPARELRRRTVSGAQKKVASETGTTAMAEGEAEEGNSKNQEATTQQGQFPQRRQPRPYISAALKREVWRRDQSQCTFVTDATDVASEGRRCEGRFGLEIDHITPVALGGESTLANLRLLCKSHNQQQAIRNFGFQKMNQFINSAEIIQ